LGGLRLEGPNLLRDIAFDAHGDSNRTSGDPELTLGAAVIFDLNPHREDTAMDKDRIKGSAEQIKGSVKEATGKALGDKNLETEGKTDKAVGKVQNAFGGLKDAVRGK